MQFGADCFVADEDELEEIKRKVCAEKESATSLFGPAVSLRPEELRSMQVRFYEYGQQGVVPPEWERFLPPED